MGDVVGHECVLNYESSPGNWSEIAKVRDNDLPMGATEIDKTSRDDGGWKGKRTGLREWGVSFDMIYITPVAGALLAIQTAFDNATSIGMQVLDSGGKGVQGDMYVTEFRRGEPRDDQVVQTVTMIGATKPTRVS